MASRFESAAALRPVRPTMEDGLSHPLLDFTQERTLSGILDRLNQLKHSDIPIETSGPDMSAQDVAQRVDAAFQQVIAIQQGRTEATGVSAPLDAEQIGRILAQNGITSTGGLRDAAVRAMRLRDNINGTYLNKRDEVLERGKYSPIHTMEEVAFRLRYPESIHAVDPLSVSDPEQKQAAVRWGRIRSREERVRVQEQAQIEGQNWGEHVEAVGTREYAEIQPAQPRAVNTEQLQFASKEALRGEQQEDADRAEAFAQGGVSMPAIGLLRPYSFAASAQRAFTGEFGRDQYKVEATVTSVREGRRASDAREYAARIVQIPLGDGLGPLRFTLLSGVEEPIPHMRRENSNHLRGAVLEQVGSVRVIDGDRPVTREDFQAFSAALKKIRQAEQQIRDELGVDLGLERRLLQYAPQSEGGV